MGIQKHSPDDWEIQDNRQMLGTKQVFILGTDENEVKHEVCRIVTNSDGSINEANARLIKAAPNLLEKLREFGDVVSEMELTMERPSIVHLATMACDIRDLIEKVEGKS